MSRAETEKRQAIIDACRRMNPLGINQGTSGNISLRHDDGMLIAPTSVRRKMSGYGLADV